jgi:large subunit ribosomal protein L18
MDRKTKVLKRRRRHLRVRKIVKGTEERPRLVVYKSASHLYAQLVIDPPFGPCKVICGASTLSPDIREELKSVKGKIEKAKLVGKLIAKRAQEKGFKRVVFDRGGYKYHGRVKALAESAREAGLDF